MQRKRLFNHLAFWMFFYCIGVYNELFLSVSFLSDPTPGMAIRGIIAQLCLMLVKVPAVYYGLYRFIPLWLKSYSGKRIYLEAGLMVILFLLLYRIMIHFVIWSYVYESAPGTISVFSYVARLFYSLLDIFQIVGIAVAIKLFKLRLSASAKEKELLKQKHESEMAQLKAQLNPHFLFNALNSIYALARNRSELAPEAVMRLSKLLRYMVYESNKQLTAIDEELKIIKDYIALQQLRFSTGIQLHYKEDIDNNAEQIPPLLLLPLIENAYKYGTGMHTEPGLIEFSITLKKGHLHLYLANTIVADSMQQNPQKGIGLKNLNRQLELTYRDFSLEHGKKDKDFVVNLSINLLSYAGYELFDSGR